VTATDDITQRPRTVLRVDPPLVDELAAVSTAPSASRAVLSRVLIVLALLIGWVLCYLFLFSGFEEARAQKALYLQLRTELAEGTAPITPVIKTGAPVALLDVPGARIHKVVVVEGTGATQLQDGPGHLRGSVLPGQQGISVIAGRALSYGAPFGSVSRLQPGSTVTVTTGNGRFVYRVQDVRRRGDPVPPPPAANSARLTMVTAGGSGALGALTPSATVFVDAVLTGKPQPSAGAVAADSDEAPMTIDTSVTTLTELVLALQLLVVVLIGAAWTRVRWSAIAAWVVGMPLVIAALWLVTGVAARLLPNLM
jgi:sortase A